MEKQINEQCKCPYNCRRHGDCQACQEYHGKSGGKTNCGKSAASKEQDE